MSVDEFDLVTAGVLNGRVVIEASAGTGKTFSLAGAVVRHVVDTDIAMSEVLVVTFTNDAADELRERIRGQLVAARRALLTGDVPSGVPWLESLVAEVDRRSERVSRLERAIASFDEATISTIHGFCQQALHQIGQRAGLAVGAQLGAGDARLVREVCRDLLIARIASEPNAIGWVVSGSNPATAKRAAVDSVLSSLVATVDTLFGNPGAVPMPIKGEYTGVRSGDTTERLDAWLDLVDLCVHEIRRRRADSGLLTFDDLIVSMREAVRHPAVVAALRDRYRLVMVDEFQDTDPLQWAIFEELFEATEPTDLALVTVGDPKQAIYRFRGADVHAYLRAVEGETKKSLSTNYRSDDGLVTAMNAVFEDLQLGETTIVANEVSARRGAPTTVMSSGSPMEIRVLRGSPSFGTATGKMSTPLMRRVVLRDLADRVVDLLENQTIVDDDGARAVRPSDIAVLTLSNGQAEAVVRALQRVKVPAVRSRSGSVFASPMVDVLGVFFEALASPSYAPVVRTAALGPFFRRSVADVDPTSVDADRRLAEVQRQCARWADELGRRPFLGWYDLVRSESGVVAALLAAPDGDRLVTDLDHLAEVLASELGDEASNPFTVARTLRELKADVDDESSGVDTRKRRIESDDRSVLVTTIHSSKGLEFPIVMIPFAWIPPKGGKGPKVDVFHDPESGLRRVDVATGQRWKGSGSHESYYQREFAAAVERRGDHLRLLYVALTRAEHRTVLWWAPEETAAKHGLNAILFDRDDLGRPLNTPIVTDGIAPSNLPKSGIPQITNPADPVLALAPLVARGGGCISVAEVPPRVSPTSWTRSSASTERPDLSVADSGGRRIVDRGWRRWSFSQILRNGDRRAEVIPVSGGLDETAEAASTELLVPSTHAVRAPLADLIAGAHVGDFVHQILQHVDPTAPDLHAEIAGVLAEFVAITPSRLDTDALVEGLVEALRSPLGEMFDGRRLADIAPTDRMAEIRFDFPLGSPSGDRRRATVSDVGRILVSTLPADDPQRAYAERLASGSLPVELAGFMQGSIDAVLRIDDRDRFVVVDYKSNRLHQPESDDPLSSYHPDVLPAAMASSHYVLQALVYSVALHRYLSVRAKDYDASRQFGGIAYLFLRGMIGEHTPVADGRPYGVFSWRLPVETLIALDELMREGVAR